MSDKISSLSHTLVKHLLKLRKDADYRQATQSCLVMGKKAISEAMRYAKPKHILSSDPSHIQVSEEVFKKITGLTSPEPMLAEFPLPQPQSLQDVPSLLVLDRVTDPGNLGSLLRSALALGWGGVFFLPHCVDPFNDKVLRASKAALFSLPYTTGHLQDLFALAPHFSAYVADLTGNELNKTFPSKRPLLVLSHESQGVSAELQDFGTKITIPIKNMESLNVAAAGAILMYELGPSHARR